MRILVRAAGIEPAEPVSQSLYDLAAYKSDLLQVAQIRAQISGKDWQNLLRLVANWASLPTQLKAAILAIVDSAKGGE